MCMGRASAMPSEIGRKAKTSRERMTALTMVPSIAAKKQQVDHRLHRPHRGVLSPKQAAVPPKIEGVVGNPEHKHPRAQPLVGNIPRQLLCHQQ